MDKTINNINNEYMKVLRPYIGNDTTFSNDLTRKGRRIFGKRYIGTFGSDQLPDIKNRQMYICNLQKSTQKGNHWISVYKKNNKLYVYDSFGRPSKKIIKSIFKKGVVIKDSEYDAEQKADTENNCGLRSMAALYMFDNHDPETVVKYL